MSRAPRTDVAPAAEHSGATEVRFNRHSVLLAPGVKQLRHRIYVTYTTDSGKEYKDEQSVIGTFG